MTKWPRVVPGTEQVPGREHFYVQILDDECYTDLIDQVWNNKKDVPMPLNGSIGEKGVMLMLPNAVQCIALEYGGDLHAFREKLMAFCRTAGRVGGVAKTGQLQLGDGRVVDLRSVPVVFD